MSDSITDLLALLDGAGVPYAVIGGHAVNTWLEPRFTAGIDVTVQAGGADMARLKATLATRGYVLTREHGADLPSGPDFVRFSSPDGITILEVQAAKTDFQREVIRRTVSAGAARVATREDLIVMKLIANRAKDQVDLVGLLVLPEIDWEYVEHWAKEWGVFDRLANLRQAVNR